jgi:lipid-A-disaccharide synthase
MPRVDHGPSGTADSLLIVAGEVSGDRHGAALVRALRARHPCLQSYGLGGEQMRQAGVETLFDIEMLGIVGIVGYVAGIPRAQYIMWRLAMEARRRGTRVAVLIDAPAFNLYFARRLKRMGLRTIGYVSPQIWAWRPGRVKRIARRIDKMLTLFPFEVPLYAAAGVEAEYVGHPLMDQVQHLPPLQHSAQTLGLDATRPIVALLPGSRRQEIAALLSPMLEALRRVRQRLPSVQGIIPVAWPGLTAQVMERIRQAAAEVTVVQGQSAQVLQAADFAFVASGTATLEAGLLGTPMIVVYKVDPLTALLARFLLRIPYIGLVNIVAGKQIVPELLQRHVHPDTMAVLALQCLEHPREAQRIRDELGRLRRLFGRLDSAQRAAESVSKFLRPTYTRAISSQAESE